MMTKVMEVPLPAVEKVVAFFLPFAPQSVLAQLSVFFANAQKIKGLGIAVLIIVTLSLFGTVEEALNTIWKVARSRLVFREAPHVHHGHGVQPVILFRSFEVRRNVMLMSTLVYIFSLDILSFLLIVLAFTVFIWVVTNTKVRFKKAAIGGLVAGVLFELERYWFSTYITLNGANGHHLRRVRTTFCSFLFRCSSPRASFCSAPKWPLSPQNFRPLLRAKKRWDRRHQRLQDLHLPPGDDRRRGRISFPEKAAHADAVHAEIRNDRNAGAGHRELAYPVRVFACCQ